MFYHQKSDSDNENENDEDAMMIDEPTNISQNKAGFKNQQVKNQSPTNKVASKNNAANAALQKHNFQ